MTPHHRHDSRRGRCTSAALISGLLCVACGTRLSHAPTTSAATTTVLPATTLPPTTLPATTLPATTDPATTRATIAANWEHFFSHTSSVDEREALLENGASLRQALEQRSTDPLMQQASARVKDVALVAGDRATVTYDVLLGDTVALPDAQGTAVLQDGVWKVSADSFCALIGLGATTPIPGCS
jgi:hypothetical protein